MNTKTPEFGKKVRWGIHEGVIVAAYKLRKYWYYAVVLNDDDVNLAVDDLDRHTVNCEVIREDELSNRTSISDGKGGRIIY